MTDVAGSEKSLLRVVRQGSTTIVSFGTSRIPEDERLAALHEELVRLGSERCKELVFDLAGVRIIPSQLLGSMAWLCRHKVDVSVCNASDEIRETLAFTQLDTIIDVHDQ